MLYWKELNYTTRRTKTPMNKAFTANGKNDITIIRVEPGTPTYTRNREQPLLLIIIHYWGSQSSSLGARSCLKVSISRCPS